MTRPHTLAGWLSALATDSKLLVGRDVHRGILAAIQAVAPLIAAQERAAERERLAGVAETWGLSAARDGWEGIQTEGRLAHWIRSQGQEE